MENREENRKRIPFKRVSNIFEWNFLFTMPMIALLTAILYVRNGRIYSGNLVVALFFASLSFILFLPALRENRFFRKFLKESGDLNQTQKQDVQIQDVRDLRVEFSGFVRYGGQRAFRIAGTIKDSSGAEITVKSPLYAVGKYTARSYAFRSGNFLNEIRFTAYTSPSLKKGTYYFRTTVKN